MTVDQAALLAGAIVNPRVLNPRRRNARLASRQRLILSRMRDVIPAEPRDADPAAVGVDDASAAIDREGAAPAELPAHSDPSSQ